MWMDIYSKPTNMRRYVLFSSNHPKEDCLRNLRFGLVRRIFTIAEEDIIAKNIKTTKVSRVCWQRVVYKGL